MEGVEVAHSREDAIEKLNGEPGSVIGGAEIFELFLPIVDSIELTEIDARPRGDTKIINPRERPEFSENLIEEFKRENRKQPGFKFWTLNRKQDAFDFPDNLRMLRRA